VARHPTTANEVPPTNHVTGGKLPSGPARTVTARVVIAVCAEASEAKANKAMATHDRTPELRHCPLKMRVVARSDLRSERLVKIGLLKASEG
jgi:hypothetical protein